MYKLQKQHVHNTHFVRVELIINWRSWKDDKLCCW